MGKRKGKRDKIINEETNPFLKSLITDKSLMKIVVDIFYGKDDEVKG